MDSSSELSELSKENEKLKKRVEQLENQLIKLKNVNSNKCFKEGKRKFDFSKYRKRHVALKFYYLGWSYDGLALQKDSKNTILEKLLEALERSKLVEDRNECNLKCCGRTDKGVSGLAQVVSVIVRSNLQSGVGIINSSGDSHSEENNSLNSNDCNDEQELDYPFLLNCVLPNDIRVLAWCPVPLDFSARFSCISRTYRYFFPKGGLDIEAMQTASAYLIGEHDFRNFCKHQPDVQNHRRTILHISIDCVSSEQSTSSGMEQQQTGEEEECYTMFCLTVRASAFLYHQIRCILAILFMVGNRHEKPEVVRDLLDVEKYCQKPQYNMAADLPLLFYESEFPENVCQWRFSLKSREQAVKSLQRSWTELSIKSTKIRNMLQIITNYDAFKITDTFCNLTLEKFSKNHKLLASRPKEKWNASNYENDDDVDSTPSNNKRPRTALL